MDAKYCATSALFRFQRKYHQTSPNLQILTVFFRSEYILKTDTTLDQLPASSYAKYVGSHVLYGLANSFFKKQAFTVRVSDSASHRICTN